MSAFWGNAIGVMIVIIMLVFIGIWIWAWRSRHKVAFDRLSALPMEDSPEPAEAHSEKNSKVKKSEMTDAGLKVAGSEITEQPHHDDKGSCS